MKKPALLFSILFLGLCILTAQPTRTPPEYNISINPTQIMTSYYDYMIGGYNSSPVQVIPDSLGGGVMMAFQAQQTLSGLRNVYLATLNQSGDLTSVTNISTTVRTSGYPSLDIDEQSGVAFMAWHEPAGTGPLLSVLGTFFVVDDEAFVPLGAPQVVINADSLAAEYIWPIVKFGPSPYPDKHRLYVMGKHLAHNGTLPCEVPKIAFADFQTDSLLVNPVLNWNYLDVPELAAWAADSLVYRRFQFTLEPGNNGSIYLCGYHTASDKITETNIDEPNLDVCICDNFGSGTWRRVSIHAEQLPSMQLASEVTFFTNIDNGSHFNAVMDAEGNINFPQLGAYYYYSVEAVENIYWHPDLQGLQQIHFDTQSETFRMDDLYPLGASPHTAPAYTPWDINEDDVIDSVTVDGYAIFPTTWPYPYWDDTAHDNAMFFYYNLQVMTEPNEQGWMACVWQDCNRARLYNTHPAWYPQYIQYAETPEIYISLSPDNGWTWLEPIVLNNVVTPELAGIKPMWVYPSNRIIIQNHTDSTAVGRLYLMFYDDIEWGSAIISGNITPLGGNVKYMAVDFVLPYTHNTDPTCIPELVSLAQNYPNPVRTSTTIKYKLVVDSNVELSIYNIKGQLVKAISNTKEKAGEHSLVWNGDDSNSKKVSSGLYFYRLQAGGKTLTRKLILLH